MNNYGENIFSFVGELLYGFFEYYNKTFDFAKDVGSIRTGECLDSEACRAYAKETKNSPGQWSAYILIEEPFDRTNAGRAIVKRDKFDKILNAFADAHSSLKSGENLKKLLGKDEL